MSDDAAGDATSEERPSPKDRVMGRVQALLAWWKQTRVARSLARYGNANGALLAGGIAYSALFSIFAGLAIAFTAFMAVLGGNGELREAVLEAIDDALPGVIDMGDGQGGILTPEQLVVSTGLSITSIIAVVVLLNSAMSVMSSLRTAIRAMFGIVAVGENAVLARVRDLGAFVVLAVAVLTTSALGIAVGAAGAAVTDWIGLGESPVAAALTRIAGHVLALGVDFLVVLFLIRVLAGARAPRRDLLGGALVMAAVAGVMRFAGTALVGSVSDNPLLAGFAAIATLLLWVNFVVRVLLMIAAWTSNPPAPPEVEPHHLEHAQQRPNYVTVTEPSTLEWSHDPHTGRLALELEPPEQEEYWGGLIGWLRRKCRGFRDA